MVVWDDQKIGDYPFQTEYSYRMNQLSRKRWLTYNVIGGCILGALMAWMVFVVSDHYFSDPARMMIAVLIGVWPTKFMEKRAEGRPKPRRRPWLRCLPSASACTRCTCW